MTHVSLILIFAVICSIIRETSENFLLVISSFLVPNFYIILHKKANSILTQSKRPLAKRVKTI